MATSRYDAFAYLYAQGPYRHYSQAMAELLQPALERFDYRPNTLLDVACGEGTFAVAMAQQGRQVVGTDLSAQMLELAQSQAAAKRARVEWVQANMARLPFRERFDLATCWFDSINYLLELDELEQMFAGVWRAVKPGGLYILDMNTIYGLAVKWQEFPTYVQQDTPHLFEVHRTAYDYEKGVAILRVTGFVRQGRRWLRIEEEHMERGYTIEQIRQSFSQAGWQELACWGSLREMRELVPESGRVWFVLRKEERAGG